MSITFFFDRTDTFYEPDSVRLLASTPTPDGGIDFNVRVFELPLKANLSLANPTASPQIPESYNLDAANVILEDAVSHDLSVDVNIAVNGVSIPRALVSFDFAYGVGKEAVGKVVLQANHNVGPASIAIGMDIEVTINGRQHFKGFVVKKPAVENNGGVVSISFEVGSQAKLRQAQNDKSLYCGIPPKNTRDLAQILSGQFGYEIDATPDGHDFEEVLEDQGFKGISAIVDAYAVTNHDVYENSNCRVQVLPRGRETGFYELELSDIIDVKWKPADETDTRSAIVLNRFTKDHGYPVEITKTEKYSDNYNVNNNLPWFKGGWTYTETFTHTKGETVVKIISNTYGYIPTSWPFVDDGSIDQCVIVSPVATAYELITTEEILNFFTPLYMDKQALWKTEKRLSGISVFRQEVSGPTVTTQWQLVQGAIARDVTLYKNELVVDPTVLICPHMQQWYQTLIRRWSFETLGNGGYSLAHYEEDQYQYQRPTAAATNFMVGDFNWTHSGNRARINEINGGWIEVPMEERGVEAAPSAVFLQPKREEFKVEGLYIGEGEEFTGIEPDVAPYCYVRPPSALQSRSYRIRTQGIIQGGGSNGPIPTGIWGAGLSLSATRTHSVQVTANQPISGDWSVPFNTGQVLTPGSMPRTWSGESAPSNNLVSGQNLSLVCRFAVLQGSTWFISSSQGYDANGVLQSLPYNRLDVGTAGFIVTGSFNGSTGQLTVFVPSVRVNLSIDTNLSPHVMPKILPLANPQIFKQNTPGTDILYPSMTQNTANLVGYSTIVSGPGWQILHTARLDTGFVVDPALGEYAIVSLQNSSAWESYGRIVLKDSGGNFWNPLVSNSAIFSNSVSTDKIVLPLRSGLTPIGHSDALVPGLLRIYIEVDGRRDMLGSTGATVQTTISSEVYYGYK